MEEIIEKDEEYIEVSEVEEQDDIFILEEIPEDG